MAADIKYLQNLLDASREEFGIHHIEDGQNSFSRHADYCGDQKVFDHGVNDNSSRQYQKSEGDASGQGSFGKEGGDSVHHVKSKQKYKSQHRSDHLAFCKRGDKYSDSQIGAAQKEKSQDCRIGRSQRNRTELRHQKRVETDDCHGNGKNCNQSQIFSHYDLFHRNGRRKEELIRFLFPLLGQYPHGKDRHADKKYKCESA